MTRICTRCNQEKELTNDNFHRGNGKGGFRAQCKLCACNWAKSYNKSERVRIHRSKKAHDRREVDPAYRKYHNEMARQWRQRMIEEGKMNDYTSNYHLRVMYKRDLNWYNETLIKQNGKCANPQCSNKPNGKRLAVDHDHACCSGKRSCGKCIRGLLCERCNHTLGKVNDSDKILLGLVDYLSQYR